MTCSRCYTISPLKAQCKEDKGENTAAVRTLGYSEFDRNEVLQSIFPLHAFVARASISGTSIGPDVFGSAKASTTASPTTSAFSGFMAPAPINHVNRPPKKELTVDATPPRAAMGIVNDLEESYRKLGRINILLMLGNVEAMVVSASRLVVM